MGPDPNDEFPMQRSNNLQFIKNTIMRPNIIASDYSYYDAQNGETFEVLGDRLVIGRFCQVAPGVTFIMNGANHKVSGFSTFLFNIFVHGWGRYTPVLKELPIMGDTVIGNDVWWDWDIATESKYIPYVTGANIEALKKLANERMGAS